MRIRWLPIAALWLALASLSAAQAPKKLTLEAYLEYETVSDPQISPDGQQILFTRQWIDKVNDRRVSDLWIMNADGSKQRFLVRGSNPRWSPDGTRIAYLAQGEPRGTQLFVRYMDAEGATLQVTRLDRTPANVTWSPDGRYLAFTMLVPKRNNWPIRLPARPEGARWTEEPRIVEELVYRRDGIGFLEPGYTHIFVVPATGGTPRQITSGDWNHGQGGISWTPDGKEILFSSLREPEAEYAWRESEIYAVNVETGAIRQLTRRKGPDYNPVVSPNGRYVAYLGYDWTDDTWIDARLYVMDIDGGNVRDLTSALDRTPQNLQWAPDNSGIYFTVDDRGTRNLYFVSLRGEIRQITRGNHMLTVTDMHPSGWFVGVYTSYHRPPDVVRFELRRPEPQFLTAVNEDILQGVKLGEVEEIWYTSTDNLRIQGWIIKPPDFDPTKKYPLILVIHGGPHAMYSVAFNFAWQLHAAEGYVVLYTNPRGSTGYGSAFGNAIKYNYPGKDYDDLMRGVDEVIRRGYIDEQNLFVYGGSGGGVLTAWIIGHTDRFAAAAVLYPVTNWLSFVGTTDGVSWYRNFQKLPWEDPSEHLRRSPLMYVGNVKTPTLLMTGVNDLRTPIAQTEEYYQALKLRKVPTAMIRFNDEFHGTGSRPSNWLRTQAYLHHWFQKWARKPQAPSGS
ncbi:MAG: S9 family peptidase [Bacteroidetes bacterium]|nr:S9 family peptidase [Rhodothermia bacterium]MCS7154879.1 S9 family peptidase [Bacteroidota bacterium]MCX7906963.1 S9 family peptidase [Bacteroidota bacterium]MDW8137673.1 S9 family peptidase [Bacteroidota bacterium]MDW8285373.1 S9 family peptidase [Bacteroidota bacterium]